VASACGGRTLAYYLRHHWCWFVIADVTMLCWRLARRRWTSPAARCVAWT